MWYDIIVRLYYAMGWCKAHIRTPNRYKPETWRSGKIKPGFLCVDQGVFLFLVKVQQLSLPFIIHALSFDEVWKDQK